MTETLKVPVTGNSTIIEVASVKQLHKALSGYKRDWAIHSRPVGYTMTLAPEDTRAIVCDADVENGPNVVFVAADLVTAEKIYQGITA